MYDVDKQNHHHNNNNNNTNNHHHNTKYDNLLMNYMCSSCSVCSCDCCLKKVTAYAALGAKEAPGSA